MIIFVNSVFCNSVEEKHTCKCKLIYIISLYKNGDKTDTNNYRGISLLDSTYKIDTRIPKDRVITDALIVEEQIGCLKGRSTINALLY